MSESKTNHPIPTPMTKACKDTPESIFQVADNGQKCGHDRKSEQRGADGETQHQTLWS